MTSVALSRSLEESYRIDDFSVGYLEKLDARQIIEAFAGTHTIHVTDVDTHAYYQQRSTTLTYYADGRAVRMPKPPELRAWKAMPTSAGKIFEWEGIVLDVLESHFSARLKNVKGAPTDFSEIAEFDINDVPHGDRDLLLPGGVFRWVVGMEPGQELAKVFEDSIPETASVDQKVVGEIRKEVDGDYGGYSWADEEPSGA